ncbi:VOC family protein [Occallatibacter savannae]|uniref:VOC family protein n=1 Tax=Occallatibacter savannae TaxID=1002691 RepID=UPI000D69FEBF|nr:VOC family protein [Occallatibacter savannae]
MRHIAHITLLTFFCTCTALSQQPSTSTAPADSFKLSKVGYVMLGVADVQKSVVFYHEKLGLTVTQQSDDLAFFDTGSISIVVSSEVGKAPGDSETVFTVDHVQPAYEALSKRGIHFQSAPHPLTASVWAASFRDPDGHVLSLFGPK